MSNKKPDDKNEDEQKAEAGAQEALVGRVLEAVRRSAEPLTTEAIQAEVNAPGASEYIPGGPIEKALGVLVERGLVERDVLLWSPVPAGKLAARRGELLKRIALESIDGVELVVPEIDCYDASALCRAGLVQLNDGGGNDASGDPEGAGDLFAHMDGEAAANIVERGAIITCAETMPECRVPSGGALILSPDAAQGELDKVILERDAALKEAELAKGQRERLRAYVRERHVNPHLIEEPPAVAPPVKAVEGDRRDTWTKVVPLDDLGLASIARELLAINREDNYLKARLESAKESHAEHISGIKAGIGELADRKNEIEQENVSGKRTLTREAVVRVDWQADEEVWIAADTGEELERRPIKKGTQRAMPLPKAADASAAAPADGGAMPVAPVGDLGTAVKERAGDIAAALGDATGKDVTVDASGAVPVFTVRDKPPAITKENVQAALVALCNSLGEDEEISVSDATERIAKVWGVEAGSALGQLVKVAARKAGEAGTIRFAFANGAESVARAREKANPQADAVLQALREAGAVGLRKVELLGVVADAGELDGILKTLTERGAIVPNGKRGVGSRFIAKEHAGDLSAEAGA